MIDSEIIWGIRSTNKRKFEICDDIDEEPIEVKRPAKRRVTRSKTTGLSVIPLDKDETKDHESDSGTLIYSSDNHIHFCTDINNTSIINLQKEVQKVINTLLEKSKTVEDLEFTVKFPPIIIHINSPGGSIFAAFKFIDYMTSIKRKHKFIKFHSIVEGRAASSATLISIVADKRFITEYGYMLIHQLWSIAMGKYNEIKDDVTNLDILMDRIKQIYKQYTKVPNDKLDEILKHDLYWDAQTCKKYKLVDTILT